MFRSSFVSNSSSSSFVVAIRKGYSWEQFIKDSGPMAVFAEKLADWISERCPQLQSIENLAMYMASRDYSKPENALEAVLDGCYDSMVNRIKELFDEPDVWMVGKGRASYNDTENPIEIWMGYGGEIDSENFKLKGL